jgi:hypothetical protein
LGAAAASAFGTTRTSGLGVMSSGTTFFSIGVSSLGPGPNSRAGGKVTASSESPGGIEKARSKAASASLLSAASLSAATGLDGASEVISSADESSAAGGGSEPSSMWICVLQLRHVMTTPYPAALRR